MTPEEREQKLVDICFDIAFTVRGKYKGIPKDRDEFGAWVASQLRGCGFDTRPCGCSWGTLVRKKGAA